MYKKLAPAQRTYITSLTENSFHDDSEALDAFDGALWKADRGFEHGSNFNSRFWTSIRQAEFLYGLSESVRTEANIQKLKRRYSLHLDSQAVEARIAWIQELWGLPQIEELPSIELIAA